MRRPLASPYGIYLLLIWLVFPQFSQAHSHFPSSFHSHQFHEPVHHHEDSFAWHVVHAGDLVHSHDGDVLHSHTPGEINHLQPTLIAQLHLDLAKTATALPLSLHFLDYRNLTLVPFCGLRIEPYSQRLCLGFSPRAPPDAQLS